MADRPIFRSQSRLVLSKPFTSAKPLENVIDHWRIKVEFRNIASDVLVTGVAEHVKLRLVRPEDRSIGTYPMQGNAGCFCKIAVFLLAFFNGLQRFVTQLCQFDVSRNARNQFTCSEKA